MFAVTGELTVDADQAASSLITTTPGVHTFTAVYRQVGSGTATVLGSETSS